MSGALGDLVVSLEANIAQFTSSMDKAAYIAEKRMKEVDDALGLVKSSLGVLGLSMASFATFDAIKSKIEGVIASSADLYQMAERTGATVEALSGLASVAKLSGTDTETLATGLQKLSKSMIDAENGGKKTGGSFEAIGISVQSLKSQKPEDAFLAIAKSLQNYQDGAEKVVVMQNLFGKAGANLIPVMNDLAEVGEFQAKITTEQAFEADQYDKTLKHLQMTNNALFKTVGLELIPVLNTFSQSMLDAQKEGSDLKKVLDGLAEDGSIQSWAENAAIAATVIVESFIGIIKTVRAVGGSFQAVGADITFLGDVANIANPFKGDDQVKSLEQALSDRNKVVEASNARYAELWDYNGTKVSDSLKKNFETNRVIRETAASKNQEDMGNLRLFGFAPEEDKTPKSKINTGGFGSESDKEAKKMLEGAIKLQELVIANEDKNYKDREQMLKTFYGMQFMSQNEYYEGLTNAINEDLQTKLDAYDKESAAIVEFSKNSGTAAERQDIKNKLAEVAVKRLAAQTEASKQLNLIEIDRLKTVNDFVLASKQQQHQWDLANNAAQFQNEMLGKGTLEIAQQTAAKKLQLDLDERIYQLRQKGISEVDLQKQISEAVADTAIQQAKSSVQIEESYNKQRDGVYGANEAVRKYAENATNMAVQIEGAMNNAFSKMEDSLVNFVKTGKLNFADFANAVIEDILRIQIRQQIAMAATGASGFLSQVFGGGSSSISSSAVAPSDINMSGFEAVAGARAGGGSVFSGSSYLVGEKGPEIFSPSVSGSIVPNGVSSSGGINVQIINNSQAQVSTQSDGKGGLQVIVDMVAGSIADGVASGTGNVYHAIGSRFSKMQTT
jgi:lambda family phage tail tape measure protein